MDPLELVKLAPLMELTAGRQEITVGLIDGPVAIDHPDFADRIALTFASFRGSAHLPTYLSTNERGKGQMKHSCIFGLLILTVFLSACGQAEEETKIPTEQPAEEPSPEPTQRPIIEQGCLTFEDLVPGTQYMVGNTFATSGMTLTGAPFAYTNGQTTDEGSVEVQDLGYAGGSGNEIYTNNINLSFNFYDHVNGLSFRFGHGGFNVNLEINGEFFNIEQSMTEVHGKEIGDTDLSVNMTDNTGTLTLVGRVDSFSVGGQEFFIDDFCPGGYETLVIAEEGCVDFQTEAPQAFPGPNFSIGPLLFTNPRDASGLPDEVEIVDRTEDQDGFPELYLGSSSYDGGDMPMRVTFPMVLFPDGVEEASVELRHFNSAEVFALAEDGSPIVSQGVPNQDVRTTLVLKGNGTPIREIEWVMVETLVYKVCWAEVEEESPATTRITFDSFPDGTTITSDTLLTGDEFLSQGIQLAGAPESSDPPYCADATAAAIRLPREGVPSNYLTSARPGEVDKCNTVPVEIRFINPVRKVTLKFMGATTTYTLQAFDAAGSSLGMEQQDAVLGDAAMVTFSLGSANVSRVTFGHIPPLPEPAITAITEISFEQ